MPDPVLIRPGTLCLNVAAFKCRPVMVFIPDQKRQIVGAVPSELLAALTGTPATMHQWCLRALPSVRYSAASWQP